MSYMVLNIATPAQLFIVVNYVFRFVVLHITQVRQSALQGRAAQCAARWKRR